MALLNEALSNIDNSFGRGLLVFLVFTCTAAPVAVGFYLLLPGPTEDVSGLVGAVSGVGAALGLYYAGIWGEGSPWRFND